jgi:hypothetical protein
MKASSRLASRGGRQELNVGLVPLSLNPVLDYFHQVVDGRKEPHYDPGPAVEGYLPVHQHFVFPVFAVDKFHVDSQFILYPRRGTGGMEPGDSEVAVADCDFVRHNFSSPTTIITQLSSRYPARRRISLAAITPQAEAWISPRLMPAPSPAANKPAISVSSAGVSLGRLE